MNQSARDEVVVITGASAGVGRATAHEFARRGARLGLLARSPGALREVAAEVRELGGQALALPADVADSRQVEEAAQRVEEELGPIDIWINNAMVTVFSPFVRMNAEEFRRATEVTYLGTVHGTLAALRRMYLRNHGTIVQVGSALAYRSIPLQSVYCGAKHAIMGFTDSVRCEMFHERKNITLTMVQLPALNTPQFEWGRSRMPRQPQPVPPIFEPEVAARGIVEGAYCGRREYWVGGTTVQAILGQRIAPTWMDWYLSRRGWEGQETEEILPGGYREGNLFHPMPQHRMRGRFGHRSRKWSAWMWTRRHVLSLTVAASALLLSGWGATRLTAAKEESDPTRYAA